MRGRSPLDFNSSCTGEAQGAAELSLISLILVGTEMWDCFSRPLEKHTTKVTNRAAKQEHGESLGQSKLECGTVVLQREILKQPKNVCRRVSREYFPFWPSSKHK